LYVVDVASFSYFSPLLNRLDILLIIVFLDVVSIEGEVVQQAQINFGQQFKVDWAIPNQEGMQLRTIWEVTSTNANSRLISAFIR
jgi:hypothetical protein